MKKQKHSNVLVTYSCSKHVLGYPKTHLRFQIKVHFQIIMSYHNICYVLINVNNPKLVYSYCFVWKAPSLLVGLVCINIIRVYRYNYFRLVGTKILSPNPYIISKIRTQLLMHTYTQTYGMYDSLKGNLLIADLCLGSW